MDKTILPKIFIIIYLLFCCTKSYKFWIKELLSNIILNL